MNMPQLEENMALLVDIVVLHQNKIDELNNKVSEIIDILRNFFSCYRQYRDYEHEVIK